MKERKWTIIHLPVELLIIIFIIFTEPTQIPSLSIRATLPRAWVACSQTWMNVFYRILWQGAQHDSLSHEGRFTLYTLDHGYSGWSTPVIQHSCFSRSSCTRVYLKSPKNAFELSLVFFQMRTLQTDTFSWLKSEDQDKTQFSFIGNLLKNGANNTGSMKAKLQG